MRKTLITLAAMASLHGCATLEDSPPEKKDSGVIVDKLGKKVDDSYWSTLRIAERVRKEGDGLPVVLLHGGGLNSSAMAPYIEFFAKKGHPTFAYDLFGHGGSEPIPLERITIDQLAQIHDEQLRKWGIGKHIAIGHSTGGMIVLQHATIHPQKYAGLVLANTLDVSPKKLDVMLGFMFGVYLSSARNNFEGQKPFDFSKQMRGDEVYKHSLKHTDPSSVGAYMDAIEGYDVRSSIGNILSPVLVIRGLKDRVIDNEGVREMVGRFRYATKEDVDGGQYFSMEHPTAIQAILDKHYANLHDEAMAIACKPPIKTIKNC
jgi:pimeloyl-ACP methyl ester carboxylesterase